MGCCASNYYQEHEHGLADSGFPNLAYDEQADEEYKQLDTENDQRGDTAVEHIFKKTKTVYGQPPKDMKNSAIDWASEYKITIANRPCPFDFPAFEGDRPPDYEDNKRTDISINRSIQEDGSFQVRKRRSRKSKGTAKAKKGVQETQKMDGAGADNCSLSDKLQ